MKRYLVELEHPELSADYILSELHLEFGRAMEPSGDPDIFRLRVEKGAVKVLVDYDHNRVWITIETDTVEHHDELCHRIEVLLNKPRISGKIEWSEVELD